MKFSRCHAIGVIVSVFMLCLPVALIAQGEKAFNKGIKAFGKENYDKAVLYYTEAAEAGNADAICELASCNYRGLGMIKDKQKAIELYEQAAALNNFAAIEWMCRLYHDGKDTAVNPDMETRYAIMAANYVIAQPDLNTEDDNMRRDYHLIYAVRLLHNPSGFVVDIKKPLPLDTVAFRFVKKAALLGSTDGMYILGIYFEHGIGVEASNTAAIAWYRAAVAHGSDQAKYGLTRLTGEQPTYAHNDYRYAEQQKKYDKEHPDRQLTKADLPGGYVSKSENDAYNAWWQKTYGRPTKTFTKSAPAFQWGTPSKTAAQRDQESYDKMHKEANQREKTYNDKWGR